jgi:hypothetical protein
MTRISQQDAERFLADVPEECVFWCHDGQVLRNMTELERALRSMGDETFAYHANAQRNDFSTWTREVIKDEELAADLGKSLNRTQAAKKVAGRVGFLADRLHTKPGTPRDPGRKSHSKSGRISQGKSTGLSHR